MVILAGLIPSTLNVTRLTYLLPTFLVTFSCGTTVKWLIPARLSQLDTESRKLFATRLFYITSRLASMASALTISASSTSKISSLLILAELMRF